MSSTGAAVSIMNNESKKNKNILLSRFKTLETSAAWYPFGSFYVPLSLRPSYSFISGGEGAEEDNSA